MVSKSLNTGTHYLEQHCDLSSTHADLSSTHAAHMQTICCGTLTEYCCPVGTYCTVPSFRILLKSVILMTKYAEVLLCDHLSITWEEKKQLSHVQMFCIWLELSFSTMRPNTNCVIVLFVVQITHKRNYEISASAQILQQLPWSTDDTVIPAELPTATFMNQVISGIVKVGYTFNWFLKF